jgi:DNA-binding transcriptional regulator YiaG
MTPADLTAARQSLGLTVAGLADALGVHRVTVHNWLAGRLPVPKMAALAIEALQARAR